MTRSLHLVDVFTDRPCAGNQLAVVTGAKGLTVRQMQAFAREMNFAETSFVMADGQVAGGWPVRIFTPREELPFAGHPTLGTAHVIRHALLGGRTDRVTLALEAGLTPVFVERNREGELYWMRQRHPTFGRRLPRRLVAPVLGLSPTDLDSQPIEEVSTGLAHLVVPVRTRRALERIRVDRDALLSLVGGLDAKSVIAFAPGAHGAGHQLTARVFVDYYGVPEDAATGSGNGCLASWLVQHRYFDEDPIDIRVEQGVSIGRPSSLHLRAMRTSHGIEVRVGGGVVDVARGMLLAARLA
ncbi:MAG TPA: PhzF family phenazine biosynthesis protein [Steroidobacteraceae bacterium]|nr:PhzF family phenazine biosynthesis protein [Steroidobacteraceae bacterium]